jgi:hypothetical protein
MLLQQTEARPNDIAGGAIAARLNLHIDEVGEMVAD